MNFDIAPSLAYITNTISITVEDLTGPPTNIRWNYGDGSSPLTIYSPGVANTTSHSYSTAGIYDIIFTVDVGLPGETTYTYNPLDPELSKLRITISDLSADFEITPYIGRLPLAGVPFVGLFSDNSVGSPTEWRWNYNDGGTGTTFVPSVSHSYTGMGTYNPLVTVYDTYGFNQSVTKELRVAGVLGISISPEFYEIPQNYTFYPVNDESAVSWHWEVIYDDPTYGYYVVYEKITTNPQDRNFNQYISAPAEYLIRLTIVDSFSDTYTAEETITLIDSSVISANPAVSEGAPVTVNFSCTFIDPSSVDLFEWDLNDDALIESTDMCPSYEYDTSGSHLITGYFTWFLSEDHTIRITVTKTITITVGMPQLVVDFSRSPSQGHKPLTVTFNGISNNPVVTWAWNFGDGGTSSLQNPTHVYDPLGNVSTYNVTLQVIDSFGQTSSIVTKSITITGTISTIDNAMDPSSPAYYAQLSGSGNVLVDENGRVCVYIPGGTSNPNITGFKR